MDNKEQLFKTLISSSKNSIYRVCFSFLDHTEDVNDLQQEIYIELWKSLDRFKGKSAWNTFIYRIAINTAIRFKTKLSNYNVLKPELSDLTDASMVTYPTDEHEEQLKSLQKGIKMLPDRERILISLLLEDLSYKEIASILNISIGHVGVRIARVKEKLKKLMNHEE